MDLAYVVGKGDSQKHNELRFSVRSAEKYLKFDRLFLIGYKPTFFNDKAIHTFVPDDQGHKYKNVAKKIRILLNDERISDDFIFMNDDFFILKEYEEIPYYYNKTIKEWINDYPTRKGRYYGQIEGLYKVFPEGKFFEAHFPIVYNKRMARAVMEKYQLKLTLMLRSFYCNEYIDRIKPEESRDHKIYNSDKIESTFKSTPFVSSTNAIATNSIFKNILLTRFPKKSQYEK
ncbi:MAG: hypothetical protein ACKKMS_00080 [Candidatus Nealsonbacteria bacterium]